MEPTYYVHAERNGKKVNIPVYNVPELDKTVAQAADSIATNLISFGWTRVKVRDAK